MVPGLLKGSFLGLYFGLFQVLGGGVGVPIQEQILCLFLSLWSPQQRARVKSQIPGPQEGKALDFVFFI